MFMRRAIPLLQLASAAYFLTCLPACIPAPTPRLEVLIMSGDATPDGLSQYNIQLENNAAINGDYISIQTRLKNNRDVVVANKKGGESKIVMETGMTTPGGHTLGYLAYDGGPVVSRAGLTAFPLSSALVTNPNAAKTDLLSAEYGGDLNYLISGDDVEPDGNGQMYLWPSIEASVNNAGQIAASVSLFNTSGGSSDNQAIYRIDHDAGIIRKIVRKGDYLPDGQGQFAGTAAQATQLFYNPLIANDGSVAFAAAINNGPVYGASGIYIGNGSEIREVVRTGDAMPGNIPLNGFHGMDYSSGGLLAFKGIVAGGPAVYLYAENSIHKIADFNNTSADGVHISNISNSVKVSDNGQVAFTAYFYASSKSGIFVGNVGALTKIALEGDIAPEGHGTFGPFLVTQISVDYSMSENGLVAFESTLKKDGKTHEAIYFYDNGNLQEVASTFDTIDGSAVVHLDLVGNNDAQAEAINEDGDVVLIFALADGRQGVAVWRRGTK